MARHPVKVTNTPAVCTLSTTAYYLDSRLLGLFPSNPFLLPHMWSLQTGTLTTCCTTQIIQKLPIPCSVRLNLPSMIDKALLLFPDHPHPPALFQHALSQLDNPSLFFGPQLRCHFPRTLSLKLPGRAVSPSSMFLKIPPFPAILSPSTFWESPESW